MTKCVGCYHRDDIWVSGNEKTGLHIYVQCDLFKNGKLLKLGMNDRYPAECPLKEEK